MATARAFAIVDGDLANWSFGEGGSRPGTPPRVQWCHGAAGIVTSLAGLAPDDDAHGALMTAGGELVWTAGPVAGNAGLCHGTGGNGFAFLALLDRTGDERWLERARAFATHGLDQVDRLRAATGRGRYCALHRRHRSGPARGGMPDRATPASRGSTTLEGAGP